MADLNPLIKVRKHDVEQKQKILSELYKQLDALVLSKEQMISSIDKEGKVVEELGTAEAYAFYSRYCEATRNKIKATEKEISKMETRVDIAREGMRIAFAELKKIEIVKDNRIKSEKKEQLRKETIELDDIGIEGFMRHKEEQ